jgi:hypothetical protein
MTPIEKSRMLFSGSSTDAVVWKACWWYVYSAPAMPARRPDSANAVSCALRGLTP